MFNSNIIDIIIILSFTYLLMALIVSTVTEIINTIFQRRNIFLQRALRALFDNISDKDSDLEFNKIRNSSVIRILNSKVGIFTKMLSKMGKGHKLVQKTSTANFVTQIMI